MSLRLNCAFTALGRTKRTSTNACDARKISGHVTGDLRKEEKKWRSRNGGQAWLIPFFQSPWLLRFPRPTTQNVSGNRIWEQIPSDIFDLTFEPVCGVVTGSWTLVTSLVPTSCTNAGPWPWRVCNYWLNRMAGGCPNGSVDLMSEIPRDCHTVATRFKPINTRNEQTFWNAKCHTCPWKNSWWPW